MLFAPSVAFHLCFIYCLFSLLIHIYFWLPCFLSECHYTKEQDAEQNQRHSIDKNVVISKCTDPVRKPRNQKTPQKKACCQKPRCQSADNFPILFHIFIFPFLYILFQVCYCSLCSQ